MAHHTVASFDAELKALRACVQAMAATVDVQLDNLVAAIAYPPGEAAQTIVSMDRSVDRMQGEIEETIVEMIARRQPVAVDLREIIATLKIATDLERIGDLAKNCSKRLMAIGAAPQRPETVASLLSLARQAHGQVRDVMRAFADRDAVTATAVWRADTTIDDLFTALFRELLTYMMEDPRSIGFCTHLLFCAKNLERVGDHATNIAENIVFVVTGEAIGEERQRRDITTAALPSA